jgi:hypothetical protein
MNHDSLPADAIVLTIFSPDISNPNKIHQPLTVMQELGHALEVRVLVADHNFHEVCETVLGGLEIGQEVGGNHGGFSGGHRSALLSSVGLPGSMQRRIAESK